MGYYTQYNLYVQNYDGLNETELDDVNSAIEALNIFDGGDTRYGWSAYEKWYDHDKNGRCQVDALHITVEEDPFDESKLWPPNNPFTVETAAEEFGVSTEYIDKIVDAFLEAGT